MQQIALPRGVFPGCAATRASEKSPQGVRLKGWGRLGKYYVQFYAKLFSEGKGIGRWVLATKKPVLSSMVTLAGPRGPRAALPRLSILIRHIGKSLCQVGRQ